MEILIGIILFYLGAKVNNWYGYDKGRKDPLYWVPAHDNKTIFWTITLITILLKFTGIGLIIYKIIKYIF